MIFQTTTGRNFDLKIKHFKEYMGKLKSLEKVRSKYKLNLFWFCQCQSSVQEPAGCWLVIRQTCLFLCIYFILIFYPLHILI